MSETSNSRESIGPSGVAGPSGTSVTLMRAELEELIDSSVQRALSGRQDPSPDSGANGGEQLDDGHHFPVSTVGASDAVGRGEGEAHAVRLPLARQCLLARGGPGTTEAKKCGRWLSYLLCPFPLQSWG